jgi:lycopene cyclase-like protein
VTTGTDVLVVGGGPAGYAAAAACAQVGLGVTLLSPDLAAPWTQTYGAWRDELEQVGLVQVAGRQWDDARVRTTGHDLQRLDRTYCLIANDRLRDTLWNRASAAGASRVAGRAVALQRHGDRVVVTTGDGGRHRVRAVVDATGQPPLFARHGHGRLARQTAHGIVASFDRPPGPPGSMCLMDFDATPFAGAEPATFLYAMDLGGGRWFVEETSLARRPGLPLAVLAARLRRRLEARGCTPVQVYATERVSFAMDPPVPAASWSATRDGVTAFGAAAALIHPATGYHVATALRRAPHLAVALRSALDDPAATPDTIAAAGTAAVWPPAARRRHALYRVGLEVLLRLEVAATQRFFAAFFALPAHAWRGYVSQTSSPGQLQATMLRVMLALPADVRRDVLRAVAHPPSLRWLAAAVAPSALSHR